MKLEGKVNKKINKNSRFNDEIFYKKKSKNKEKKVRRTDLGGMARLCVFFFYQIGRM
jgi:hypothetical protein